MMGLAEENMIIMLNRFDTKTDLDGQAGVRTNGIATISIWRVIIAAQTRKALANFTKLGIFL